MKTNTEQNSISKQRTEESEKKQHMKTNNQGTQIDVPSNELDEILAEVQSKLAYDSKEILEVAKQQINKWAEDKYGFKGIGDRNTELLAMNIVHQIGDVLGEELKKGNDYVTARQNTNDIAINFVGKLINKWALEKCLKLIKQMVEDNEFDPLIFSMEEHLIDSNVLELEL